MGFLISVWYLGLVVIIWLVDGHFFKQTVEAIIFCSLAYFEILDTV